MMFPSTQYVLGAMTRLTGVSILLLALWAVGGTGIACAADAPAHPEALILRRQMINDPFINKDAYSVMAPDKWKVTGQINWVPGRPTPDVYIVASNPDNTVAYQQMPRLFYEANVRENRDYMFPAQRSTNAEKFAEGQTVGLMNAEIRHVPASPKEYLLKILIPKSFPGMAKAPDFKVVGETDMPDYAKAAKEHDPLHRENMAARVRVTYTTPKGPMAGEFVIVLTMLPLKQAMGVGPRPEPPVTWVANTQLCRAPADKFEASLPTLAGVQSSVQVQLPWFNIMQQVASEVLTALQEAEMKQLVDFGKSILKNQEILRKAAQEKSDLVSREIHDKFAETMAAHDMMQTREMHYITNTGNYRDPQTGGLLNLSEDYKYHFTNGSGLFIETNEPNPAGFAPNELKSMDRVN